MIFIPGNVPSSKNSKQWTGKFLVHSAVVRRYIKATQLHYIDGAAKFYELIKDMPKPYNVAFRFIRDSRRQFDYVNPLQTVQDLMVQNHWLEDDNADEILPIFIPYAYDKGRPGVEITVRPVEKWIPSCS